LKYKPLPNDWEWSDAAELTGRMPQEMRWLVVRWLELLESLGIGNSEGRGRRRKRYGDVNSLNVIRGEVNGSVLSGSKSYKTIIKFDEMDPRDWSVIAKRLFAHPATAVKLSVHILPEGVEKVFGEAGLRLFPHKDELVTGCTCGDRTGNCDHAKAILHMLATMFEIEPFVVFLMRGIGVDDLMKVAGLVPVLGQSQNRDETGASSFDPCLDTLPPEPIPEDPGKFWGRDLGTYDPGHVLAPKVHAALPKQLGKMPYWEGSTDFILEMEETYAAVSSACMRMFPGDAGDGMQERGAAGRRKRK